MERYEAYKDSGIEWIGEIPEGWGLLRVKNVVAIGNGSDPKTEGSVPVYGSGEQATKTCGEFKQGPAVLLGRKGSIDRPKYVEGPYWNVDTAFDCKSDLMPLKLFYYLATCFDYARYSTNTTVPSMTSSQYENMTIPMPSELEQQVIADFLDEKTSEIDEIVSETERSIELLREYRKSVISEAVTKGLDPDAPMKDSGVEWIGEIPEGWGISHVKFVSRSFGRIGFRGYKAEDLVEEGEGALTLSPGNLAGDGLSFQRKSYLSWEKYEESPEIKVFAGDVLFTKTGSSYGKSAFVCELDECATINPQLLIFKEIEGSSKFFYYTTCARWFLDQVEQAVVGGTIPTIAQEKIGNMYIVWPSRAEQERVVDYLDAKTAEIDALIADKEKQVELLKEYRKSLISEAVTGKFKVPGVR